MSAVNEDRMDREIPLVDMEWLRVEVPFPALLCNKRQDSSMPVPPSRSLPIRLERFRRHLDFQPTTAGDDVQAQMGELFKEIDDLLFGGNNSRWIIGGVKWNPDDKTDFRIVPVYQRTEHDDWDRYLGCTVFLNQPSCDDDDARSKLIQQMLVIQCFMWMLAFRHSLTGQYLEIGEAYWTRDYGILHENTDIDFSDRNSWLCVLLLHSHILKEALTDDAVYRDIKLSAPADLLKRLDGVDENREDFSDDDFDDEYEGTLSDVVTSDWDSDEGQFESDPIEHPPSDSMV